MPRITFSLVATFVPLLILTGFRAWLYFERRAELCELDLQQRLRLFWVGLRLDAVIVSRFCAAVVLFALLAPDWLFSASRPFLLTYLGLAYFICLLIEIGGLYFFRYYDCRPNYLVFEHGADTEVLKTIVKAYPVARMFVLTLLGTGVSLFLVTQLGFQEPSSDGPLTSWYWDRCSTFAGLLFVAFATRGTFDHRPLNPSLASITTNRVANEIASCGVFNLMYEWNHQLRNEFVLLKTVMKVPPLDEAVRCVRQQLSTQGVLTDDSPNPLVRQFNSNGAEEPLNVVLVVMESFTSRLVGCVGGQPALSPEFDRLAAQGVLFERCYATGERTIQGLEASVSSFPPLPGAGVVKRPQARQGFATLATTLRERGYETLFLYGGQGIFDHMRSFFLANGFQNFIEEKDFTNPSFRSPWGVSDEDLFQRTDHEFRRLDAEGRSFCATLLTVSLHSPWEYPPGRIEPLPAETPVPAGFKLAELNNFLYADYAVGKFIREARKAPYFDKTLFVFVGDHGVHLRGAELVPIDEYRVPALFFCPSRLRSERIARVTSQIDLPPTIMGILGGDYRSAFFGNDVLRNHVEDNFAICIYNKKRYGIVSDHELIVLAETGEKISYERDGANRNWRQVTFSPAQTKRAVDASALLRVAEDLLVSSRYTTAKT